MAKINKGSGAWLCAAALAALLGRVTTVAAADISGAGATFPAPVYAKWAEAYKKETNIGLNYQSIGSGGGIKQIEASTVTFGASDKPLEPKELEANGLVQWPMIIGGVVPTVNVQGVKPGELILDGPTIADIYLGTITKWDDAAHQGAEPGPHAAEPGDRPRIPLGRLGHELSVHDVSLDREREVQVRRRCGRIRVVAHGPRREGQRRRREHARRARVARSATWNTRT